MPRQAVPLKDVQSFVTELEAGGAMRIRRSPPDVRGRVMVRWKPSPTEEVEYAAALRSYRAEFGLAAIIVAIVVGILVVVSL
ncbi:MAG: hypothetical protein LJF04_06800 [Gemmatimonadetes bacterium]|nr:hypothetical protein [Gemmatimonadota bacterium]